MNTMMVFNVGLKVFVLGNHYFFFRFTQDTASLLSVRIRGEESLCGNLLLLFLLLFPNIFTLYQTHLTLPNTFNFFVVFIQIKKMVVMDKLILQIKVKH